MAAAELHEVVAAVGSDLGGDDTGQPLGDLAITEFVHVLHDASAGSVRPASAISASVFSASSGSRRVKA